MSAEKIIKKCGRDLPPTENIGGDWLGRILASLVPSRDLNSSVAFVPWVGQYL